MKIKLPPVLKTYVEASNASDLPQFISCFSKTATVLDERKSIKSHSEIEEWFKRTRRQYQFQSEPLNLTQEGDHFLLQSRVTGSFPGSPITITYRFLVQNDSIQDLRIT
ncbi:MAG: nuclear transport factor 2 family protein [Bdellovibrionales bacterium]|nr:nuclear transport factor 2 family protein [Bdellovibrionales bacterium]